MGKVQEKIKDFISTKKYNKDIKKDKKSFNLVQESKYLFKLGRYDEALRVCNEALESDDYSSDLFILKGKILNKLQKFEEALSFFKKALEIKKRDFGENNLDIADILIDIGELYKSEKNYDEAISNYSIALDIQKHLLGVKHPAVAKTFSSLAELHELVSDLEKALLLYKSSFDIQEFSLGYNHPEVANTLNNLGRLYTKLDRLDDALNSYERALAIQERFYGLQDQEALSTLNEMSKIYVAKNQFNEATALSKRIIKIKKNLPNFEKQAWNNFYRLTVDEKNSVKTLASSDLASVFSFLPDKQQAWNYLHRLTTDQNNYVRYEATSALGSVFLDVPDKQQAWNDLHKLISDQNNYVRYEAASVLGSVFSDVPDKQQAWNDLHKLISDQNSYVRYEAASALGSVFSDVPDKQQAWDDLHKLTNDQNWNVRSEAASALGSIFSHVLDKQQAWDDLHKLANDQNWNVRSAATFALGSAFSQVPDKQQAWDDLHKLTNDINSGVRSRAAEALGSIFSQVPDKQQAWNDLHKLISDEDRYVRTYANHSLGKVSIFKASQSEKEEDYKRELETAIVFFEKAAKESPHESLNPSQFCLPFYRSFYTIIFKKYEGKEKADKYLTEAKAAIGDSKENKLLFEAVENLSNALKEVQILESLDFQAMKSELSFYKNYCDRATELMKDTEKSAPFATITMRKGLPILNRNLKELIEEIQEKAKAACKESKGTDAEEIACAVNKEVQKWEISSQEEMTQKVEDIVYILKKKVADLPENEYILNKIEEMKHERNLKKQYDTLFFVIGQIPTMKVASECIVVENVNKVGQELETKLNTTSQERNKIRICLKPEILEEFEISSEIEILGTDSKNIVTIPLQEISYAELNDDLKRIKSKYVTKLSELPNRLARKIKGHLLLIDKEDLIEQLT